MNSRKAIKDVDEPIRVTLRISEECGNDILWLARYCKTTQKGVFDIIARSRLVRQTKENDVLLSALISSGVEARRKLAKVRKAQVMSRNAQKFFGMLSKQYSVSRDILIEALLRATRIIAETDRQPIVEKHKEALKIVNAFWKEADIIENKLKELLGDEDPIINRFGYVIIYIMNLSNSISKEIEEGIPVDPEEF